VAAKSFSPLGELTASSPPNFLTGFEGRLLCGGGKGEERRDEKAGKERGGRDERTPSLPSKKFWLRPRT